MAQLRLRIEMNKGRLGAPLEKLGAVAAQLQRFLRSLSNDLGLGGASGDWLAMDFQNGSVCWNAALAGDVPEVTVRAFNDRILFIADFDPETDGTNGLVSDSTLAEYGRIGEALDPDEVIGVGIFAPRGRQPKMRQLSYRKMHRVRRAVERPIESHGSIQGLMHSLHKEAPQPFFQIREAATDHLVKCIYGAELYDNVVKALRERAAIVHATGSMLLDRIKRQVSEMHVERIDAVEPLSDEEFQSLFGMAPGFTGRLSTNAFIDKIREDG